MRAAFEDRSAEGLLAEDVVFDMLLGTLATGPGLSSSNPGSARLLYEVKVTAVKTAQTTMVLLMKIFQILGIK